MTVKHLPFREDPDESPAERTHRLMLAHPEMLEEMAKNYHEHYSGLLPAEADRAWKKMSEDERARYRKSALVAHELFIAMSPAQQHLHNQTALRETLERNDKLSARLSLKPLPAKDRITVTDSSTSPETPLTEAEMRGALLVAGQASLGDHVTRKGQVLLGTAFIQLCEDVQHLKRQLGLPPQLTITRRGQP